MSEEQQMYAEIAALEAKLDAAEARAGEAEALLKAQLIAGKATDEISGKAIGELLLQASSAEKQRDTALARVEVLEEVVRNLVQLIVGLSPDHAKSAAILEAQALAGEK